MFKLENDKATIDIFELIHDYVPEDRKLELAESLSCSEVVIKHVVDQVLDGCTENIFSGSEVLSDSDSMSELQKARRRIAEQSSEVAEKEINRLKEKLERVNKRLDECLENQFKNMNL